MSKYNGLWVRNSTLKPKGEVVRLEYDGAGYVIRNKRGGLIGGMLGFDDGGYNYNPCTGNYTKRKRDYILGYEREFIESWAKIGE